MFEWVIGGIPWWWYLGLAIFLAWIGKDVGFFTSGILYCMFSICGVAVYYMLGFLWMFTGGLFFDSAWDMPWWVWVIGGLALLGSGGGAVVSTVIHHRSDERVSDITITKK